jgi:1,4-alpha-glucan branching enzyme
VSWLTRPRTVRISPLHGAALAAGLAAVVVATTLTLHRDVRAPVTTIAHASGSARLVQFVFVAPRASSVTLVGDFNDWDDHATPLRAASSGGLWSVEVPLAPGRHLYAFVVDGTTWRPDPAAPPSRGEDFGTPNSVVTVAEGGTQ